MTEQNSETTEEEASELLGLNTAAIAAEPETEAAVDPTPAPTPEPEAPAGQLDVHFHEEKPKTVEVDVAPRKNPVPEAREVTREDGSICLPGDFDYPYDEVIGELNKEAAMIEVHVNTLKRASTLLRTAQAKFRRKPTLAELNAQQQEVSKRMARESNERKQKVQDVLEAAGLLTK